MISLGRPGKRLTQHFPVDTPPEAMQRWRLETKALYTVQRKQRANRGTFEGDARRYLDAVKGMPTIAQRRSEMRLWIAVFGTRQRDSITAAEIRAQRDHWKITARGGGSRKHLLPVAPATINKRLRALSNLYTVLDGSQAHNPVRDVPELPEPTPQVRTLTHADLARIIGAMSDRGNATRRGAKRPHVSPTKIRVRCLSYCQITPKQLSQLQPADLDLARRRIHLPQRAKGRGAAAVWVDLLPDAVAAFRDFHQHHLYGPFSQAALRHAWQRAAKKVGIVGAKPYDARHTMGALIYRATKSRDAVQQLMQHASWSTSARYAAAAEDEVRTAHSRAVVEMFGGKRQRVSRK